MSSDHREDLDELCARMGVPINDRVLLARALTHRSYANQQGTDDYERLEFLGDAVLELAISHVLWEAFPDMDAGDLTKFRASIVNKKSLAGLARKLDLGPFIRLSRGEAHTSGREKNSILADVYEAILGAMYLDRGIRHGLAICRQTVRRHRSGRDSQLQDGGLQNPPARAHAGPGGGGAGLSGHRRDRAGSR